MKAESYKNNKLSVVAVDLFCGVGGLTYGLNKSGIKVVAGVDVDERCKFAFVKDNRDRHLFSLTSTLRRPIIYICQE